MRNLLIMLVVLVTVSISSCTSRSKMRMEEMAKLTWYKQGYADPYNPELFILKDSITVKHFIEVYDEKDSTYIVEWYSICINDNPTAWSYYPDNKSYHTQEDAINRLETWHAKDVTRYLVAMKRKRAKN